MASRTGGREGTEPNTNRSHFAVLGVLQGQNEKLVTALCRRDVVNIQSIQIDPPHLRRIAF